MTLVSIVFKNWFNLIVLLFISINSFAQHKGPVNWYSAEEAYQAYLKSPKPIFIDVYTDWCGWCKRMDATTFQDKEIATYLNQNFYPVKLNAETKEDIDFLGKTYVNSQEQKGKEIIDSLNKQIEELKNKQSNISEDSEEYISLNKEIEGIKGKIYQTKKKLRRTSHDFAIELMRGQMSYPTLIFLFDSLKNNMPAKGALQPNQLAPLLSFIADEAYKGTKDVNQYQKLYNAAQSKSKELINWTSLEEAIEIQSEKNKKILIQFYHPTNKSSEVMVNGTYQNPEISSYVNENFIPVKFNITDTNALNFKGNIYKNVAGVHQFAGTLMEGQLQLPFLAIIDEEGNLTMKISQFFMPDTFGNVLKFIKSSAYEEMNYAQWLKKQQ